MNSSAASAFRALEIVKAASQPIGVTEVARRMGTPVSSAHRVLATLEQAGFAVRYQSSSKWVFGPLGRQLAYSFFSRFRVRQLALPYLRQLSYVTGETISLSVPIGGSAVRIASVSGPGEVVNHRPLGELQHLPESTAARILFSFAAIANEQEEGKRKAETLENGLLDYEAIRLHRFCLKVGAKLGNSEEISLPVLLGEVAIAAVTIEGPIRAVEGITVESVFQRCISVVDALSEFARAEQHLDKDLFTTYDHLDRMPNT